MKRSEFLRELKLNLETRVSPDELKDILSDYESFFISGEEDGRTDEEISKELGSPAFIAKSLLEEHSNQGTKQLNKRITNPGRRICAYLIDAVIAVIPMLLLSIFIGAYSLPYFLIAAYPSPANGVLATQALMIYTTSDSTSSVAISSRTESVDNENGVRTVVEEQRKNAKHPMPARSILAIMCLVFYVFYSLICTLLFKGQTIGKKLMHIQIRYSSTEPTTTKAIFYREFLGKTLLNSIPILPLISIFTILFTKEHKALHDMLADTIVSDV
ncbi:RDD family protein [Cohnella abietis]|uniref:RDD domain-containing protein n=1 Tax=Cohnella abietis TaxID=2507935 RepID=A0A3T1CYB6_9BACL|nr:RDD family protein [Cohnella abietis]BBI30801.1 hypothetical protein KCTCHS21_02000 [Cohnella abietis]BBI30809.1 hypothetical protein KCTCHS21_02080 [Cohnella abietis]